MLLSNGNEALIQFEGCKGAPGSCIRGLQTLLNVWVLAGVSTHRKFVQETEFWEPKLSSSVLTVVTWAGTTTALKGGEQQLKSCDFKSVLRIRALVRGGQDGAQRAWEGAKVPVPVTGQRILLLLLPRCC